jgi:Ca2+-dependent lipid-binding protein
MMIDDVRGPYQLSLEFVYEEARSGMVQITLFEAVGLRNIDPMGQQDPYVQFSLGDNYKKRSRTIKNGGTKPYFAEEEILMWVNQDNWTNDLHVDLYDDDVGQEKPIGYTHFSLLQYMNQSNAKEEAYELFYMNKADPKDDTTLQEVAQGQVMMRVRR